MAAYATQQRESWASERPEPLSPRLARIHPVPDPDFADGLRSVGQPALGAALLEQLVDRLADRLATALAERLGGADRSDDEWFDSLHAAEYLGVHCDTLRKLAAERAIRYEQDGPGCKLYFRRSDLDAWRRSGGRPRHLATAIRTAA